MKSTSEHCMKYWSSGITFNLPNVFYMYVFHGIAQKANNSKTMLGTTLLVAPVNPLTWLFSQMPWWNQLWPDDTDEKDKEKNHKKKKEKTAVARKIVSNIILQRYHRRKMLWVGRRQRQSGKRWLMIERRRWGWKRRRPTGCTRWWRGRGRQLAATRILIFSVIL